MAIVAAFNEADIIGQVVADLIEQGVQVYVLDDGSTDGTVDAVRPYEGRGLLAIESVAGGAGPVEARPFEWERILQRKAELARSLDADWFIHHDADELRESPWVGMSLLDAITAVDALGFNAIDFAGFDFWPVDDDFRPGDDLRRAFAFCSEQAAYDKRQVRCWKKADDVDLAWTGGHEARFAGRQVFPLRFISRHYPIRSQAHGQRKVFRERKRRFLEAERAKGWHVQYDDVREGDTFIRDASQLVRFDPLAVRRGLMLRTREVEAAEQDLAGAKSALEETRETLRHRTSELDERTRDLASRREELRLERGARAAAGQELARLHAQLVERRAEIDRLNAAIGDATRRVAALEGSRSWRWTAPVRAAWRLLGGR